MLTFIQATKNFVWTLMNGFSDFIVSIFGERGKHARAAVGMASLPNGMAVEIEMIVEIKTP
jgi:enamine deaminase RidA (YjgF/YER057c/UK114 family)